ncbi:hypothetical protein [Sneathiella sp.]|uniref:hypothetical protein n=1 Tax=Sneathiella sp. TaxID=1964365 RepID=UPI002FE0C5FE
MHAVSLKKKVGRRALIIGGILIGLAIVLGANAHLVYVATTSDPACVLAKSDVETTDKIYRPVKSGC